MVCIYCGGITRVTNSRSQKESNQIWRRRHCIVCSSDFTTHEIADLDNNLMVRYVGKHGISPFSRDSLFVSVYESCKHRPTAARDAGFLSQTIIAKLMTNINGGLLDRDVIVDTVASVLEHFDQAAATSYKAYHAPSSKQSKVVALRKIRSS
jgi:transcriptional regulator NrdR family protein